MLTLTSILVHKLQSIPPKQDQKQIKHECNKLYILQIRRKKEREVSKRIKAILSSLQEINSP